MIITDHAYDRAKERCGWNRKALERMTEKVISHGKDCSNYAGKLKKWIDSVYFSKQTASKLLVFGNYLFIFCQGKLVTIYQIPNYLTKGL